MYDCPNNIHAKHYFLPGIIGFPDDAGGMKESYGYRNHMGRIEGNEFWDFH